MVFEVHLYVNYFFRQEHHFSFKGSWLFSKMTPPCTMTYRAAIAIFIALVAYKFYRWLTRISIADIRGPPPESFILGKHNHLKISYRCVDPRRLGNLRQYFQSLAGEVSNVVGPHFSCS